MPEKDQIFSSAVKYTGNFSFKDFYQFCYDWITEQIGMADLSEDEYTEKVAGDEKEIQIKWTATKKLTDYFKFELKASFHILKLKKVEIVQDGVKLETNKGQVKLTIKGNLIRDYEGKFESGGRLKFLRGIYEKWVIPTRVDEFEDKVAGGCDELLTQAKAFLDLEGKK